MANYELVVYSKDHGNMLEDKTYTIEILRSSVKLN